ncbi:MAG: anti-sigma factor antagonist [Ardenticatenaceae bacterium]|nr:anti-sigma factor antagonist [Anaerolineales bacterium]MCB8937818.1 anti-sigma factor antagonist [Ardenticatenaceae bacterium]MCB8974387.1 anti-sigma factor antagonist [Ardenticatenaceae bacterium]
MTRFSKADIHIHTTFSDGLNEPEAVVNYVLTQTDLSVIAITDHNTIAGAEVAYDYWHKHRHDFRELEVIKGVEVSSAEGHILGLFLEEDIPMNLSAADTVDAIHEQGGLAIAAHPFTHLLPFTDFHGVGRRIAHLPLDGVEARSSVPTELYANWMTLLYNRRHAQHATLGSSDAHYLTMVGKTYTLFPGKTAVDFRQAVEAKTVRDGGRVNGPIAVWQVVLHLLRQRQLPIFLPNDKQFRHATADLIVDTEMLNGLTAVLKLNGRLTRNTADLLKKEGLRLLRGNYNQLVLNFAETSFVDSAGLGVLVALQKRLSEQGGRLAVCNLATAVAKTIQLVRLDHVLKIFASEADALTQLSQNPANLTWQPV